MVISILRALVVDDEPHVQKLVTSALRHQGFQCDVANDGLQAEEMLGRSSYDVVLTDLRMPIMHGHALVQKLLERPTRPLIVVHTGVIEPKLAQDLLQRGVDDILFKPVSFPFLAAKVLSLVERRRSSAFGRSALGPASANASSPTIPENADSDERISFAKLNSKLADLKSLLPVSNAALEVVAMTRDGDWDTGEIAAAIQRDASLAAEVLRIANSSLFNPSGRHIARLEESVLRIGHKKIGEMAIVTSALSALTPAALPWIDADLMWKRSMAAGIVLEMLIEAGNHQGLEEGLLLSAIMHPLGRVVLGTIFPKYYEAMIRQCELGGDSLREHERRNFPISETEAIAQLLGAWNIPREAFLPIRFSSDDFSSLVRLSEPMRTRAELVKTAIVLARLVVGRWQSWDLIQLPSPWLLSRLGVDDVSSLLRQARSDLVKLASFSPSGVASRPEQRAGSTLVNVSYCDVANGQGDLLAELLPTLGFQPIVCSGDELLDFNKPILVNCLGMQPGQFVSVRQSDAVLIVTDAASQGSFSRLGRTTALPISCARLRSAILDCFSESNPIGKAEPAVSPPRLQLAGV